MRSKIILVIFAFLFVPVFANALTLNISETNLVIELDDSWSVFTRDNIENNALLDQFNISYDYIYNFFNDNNIYMDSYMISDDGNSIEFFIRKTTYYDIDNLSNFSDDEIFEYAKSIAESKSIYLYDKYINEAFKFVFLDYFMDDYYLQEYITIVNSDLYTFTFQKEVPFLDDEKNIIKDVMNNTKYDYNSSEKVKSGKIVYHKMSYLEIALYTLLGVLGGCLVGCGLGFVVGKFKINKREKEKQNKKEKKAQNKE